MFIYLIFVLIIWTLVLLCEIDTFLREHRRADNTNECPRTLQTSQRKAITPAVRYIQYLNNAIQTLRQCPMPLNVCS